MAENFGGCRWAYDNVKDREGRARESVKCGANQKSTPHSSFVVHASFVICFLVRSPSSRGESLSWWFVKLHNICLFFSPICEQPGKVPKIPFTGEVCKSQDLLLECIGVSLARKQMFLARLAGLKSGSLAIFSAVPWRLSQEFGGFSMADSQPDTRCSSARLAERGGGDIRLAVEVEIRGDNGSGGITAGVVHTFLKGAIPVAQQHADRATTVADCSHVDLAVSIEVRCSHGVHTAV